MKNYNSTAACQGDPGLWTSMNGSCVTASWLQLHSIGIIADTIERFIYLSKPDFVPKKKRSHLFTHLES